MSNTATPGSADGQLADVLKRPNWTRMHLVYFALAAIDLLAVCTAGAYGYSMSSNYNSRPRPAEVLVDETRFAIMTERETLDDLMRLEQTHLHWRST